jgi:hypothetical protein
MALHVVLSAVVVAVHDVPDDEYAAAVESDPPLTA